MQSHCSMYQIGWQHLVSSSHLFFLYPLCASPSLHVPHSISYLFSTIMHYLTISYLIMLYLHALSYSWKLYLLYSCYFLVPYVFLSNAMVDSFAFFRFEFVLFVFYCLLTDNLYYYFSINIITRREGRAYAILIRNEMLTF